MNLYRVRVLGLRTVFEVEVIVKVSMELSHGLNVLFSIQSIQTSQQMLLVEVRVIYCIYLTLDL